MHIVTQPFALLSLGYRTVELTGNIVNSIKKYSLNSAVPISVLTSGLFHRIITQTNAFHIQTVIFFLGLSYFTVEACNHAPYLTCFRQWNMLFMVNS